MAVLGICFIYLQTHCSKIVVRNCKQIQDSRAVARKPRDGAAVIFGLKFADDTHYNLRVAKLRKPGFRAPNIPAQNRI